MKSPLALFSATVAGPALVVAGFRYPGTLLSKVVLMSSGVLLIGYNTKILTEETRLLFGPQKEDVP